MAVIKKTLFAKNLDKFAVLVNDTQSDSKYFKITELPDVFTGGKNAFLIAGSEYLVPDTRIQIELKDSIGNIIYHEPAEGGISSSINGESFVTEYYEGVSKVVSVYVYSDTAYGPCTLTILGELSEYEDSNGIISPVPFDWENKYNVKWQKQIDVNPSLANTTKIRFYQRPQAIISEIISPIFRIESGSKVNSGVNQSFANIKIKRLETFAGDVKRVKVFRTSLGDISDFDLIQDILIESKELLTTFDLSGSTIGNTGIFTSETLENFWNTGSLNVQLTSDRVESGIKLSGSGNFIYTSSLDIQSANTYELNLDAFYSSSTTSNLDIHLTQATSSFINGISTPTTISSSIATLVGTQPTKNLLDTVIPFKLDRNFPEAKLQFSTTQGEWHLGNISLRLSEDTAFSPDEISFITTMPTVVGNEDFNFKFEFYDVNNNFVPVLVTGSANFTGGTSPESVLISASLSQSLAVIAAVSTSISGTMTVYSQSADTTITNVSSSTNTTITNVSSSISGSIISLSGSVSSSINTLSSSIANELILTSGSVTLLSGSFLQFTQSVAETFATQSLNLSNLSSSVSTSLALNTSQSAFQVFSASQYLDKFIFTDENGKINQPPTASEPGLYLGSTFLGYFSGSDFKTYMDNEGDFYLTSSVVGGGFLAWNSSTATLQVQGAINIQGGNAVTTSSLNSATASLSQNIFTDASGNIVRPPNVRVGVSNGLFLGSTNLGYYDGDGWKTYMDNQGNFFLEGPGNNSLQWQNGQLSVNGTIGITGGNAATTSSVATAQATAISTAANDATTKADAAQAAAISTAANDATTKANSAQTAAELFAASAAGRAVTSGSNAATTAQETAINQAKADASASINLLANGGWTAGTGTFITARSISSPVLAGNAGYIAEILRVGENGITLDGGNKKIFVGTGTYSNSNTPFFFASGSNNVFSLGDKLSWDGNNLSIIGNITVSDGPVAAAISNLNSTTSSLNSSVSQINTATGSLTTAVNNKITSGSAAADVNSNVTNINGGKIRTGLIQSNNHSGTGDGSGFATAGTSIDLTGGGISAKNFRITSGGDAFLSGSINTQAGNIGGWSINSSQIFNSNVEIDNTNSRIDFKSGSIVKTRIKSGNVNIGSTATSSVTIPKQDPVSAFYSGNSTGPNNRTLIISQSVSEYAITTPSGVTGNKLSIKIPTYGISSLGSFTLSSVGNGTSYQYGYKAYIDYKISSSPGGAGDIEDSTYYFYNGDFGDINVGTTIGTYDMPGISAGSIPIYSDNATDNQVFYISTTYYVEILTRGNAPSGFPPPTLTGTWNVVANGWASVTSATILVAVANRAEYGSNGVQIGTNDGNFAAMGDAAGSGLSGLFNGGVQIFGVLTAALASSSDRRAKTNIKPLQNATNTLKKLNPVSFDWLQHQTNVNEFSHSYGFIADEIEEVLPNMVMKRTGLEYDDFKYLDYNSFHALAIKAILELTEKVEKLESIISGSV